jgi:hypothetical protein
MKYSHLKSRNEEKKAWNIRDFHINETFLFHPVSSEMQNCVRRLHLRLSLAIQTSACIRYMQLSCICKLSCIRICVTYKTGFGFDDRIYWTFIHLVTAVHKSPCSAGHSRLLTMLH